MSVSQSVVGREHFRLTGGSAEPIVSAEVISAAVGDNPERFRALLPVGYQAGVDAYKQAVSALDVNDLTSHYTDGVQYFHNQLIPYLKDIVTELSGGVWHFDDYVAYGAGSDVDMMTHIVSAVSQEEEVKLFPGDWFGFKVGVANQENIHWNKEQAGSLACLCVPSVRNGHVTQDMLKFLQQSSSCLLNINLYPTLHPIERKQVAQQLNPVLEKSILSISFSRGFGLTGSQLGVMLIHKDHPLRHQYDTQWKWLTYFYNGIAAKAFMVLDINQMQRVDEQRRDQVVDWLLENSLPVLETGSYYVKSYQIDGEVNPMLESLHRNGLIRLCLKPTAA